MVGVLKTIPKRKSGMFKFKLTSLFTLLRSSSHREWEATGDTSRNSCEIGLEDPAILAKQAALGCEHSDAAEWLIAASNNPMR
jgi:hypothetical protein